MNSNDNLESTNIELETLEKEYMVVLKSYETAYKNYISNINNENQNKGSESTKFSALQSRSYWGTYGIKEGSALTQTECETMCLSDTKCTGATFNPSKRYCWVRGGESNLTTGIDSDYALIPKVRESLILLKNLNQKLIDINKRISNKLNIMYPLAKEDANLKNQKQQELNQYYASLLKEKTELDIMLKDYQTLEEELNNNTLYVNQQNASLRIWVFLAFILLVITIKNMAGINTFSVIVIILLSIVAIIYISINK